MKKCMGKEVLLGAHFLGAPQAEIGESLAARCSKYYILLNVHGLATLVVRAPLHGEFAPESHP